MGSLKWKKCLGSLKKAVFALFLIVSPKKGIKKAKNDGQNGTCNWFLPGKAVFLVVAPTLDWGWPMGAPPWPPRHPYPVPDPVFALWNQQHNLGYSAGGEGVWWGSIFPIFSFNPWPSTPPCIPLQCLVQMVLSYGITGDVDIDASLTINNVNYFIHQTDKLA